MPLPSLLLPPDQANYVSQFGHTVISTELDGGASRFRGDQLGSSFKVTVQWTMNVKNYNYLTAFYRNAINFGADPFTVGLYLDSAAIQNYTAHFVPDSFGLTSQQGLTFIVGAVLEVIPDSSYYATDAATVAAGPDV